MMSMSERKKSLFLTRFSPPPLKIQHEFSKTQMHEKIHTKKWRKIKIWFNENQNLIERKKWKTDIFTKFYKNDESMISKKGVRSNTVKETIRELSESDDEQVWDRSFRFMMTSCLCEFGCLMHYFFFGPNSGITSSWNLLQTCCWILT